ncbi:MAG: 50S ribosomal protein L4 [Spirochaetales bacterium]|nr:MAG: 50S ribosomal protein L4 [Spirochaetales bacterium]
MEKPVLSLNGQELRNIELNDEVFNRDISEGAIYHAIRNELANRRVGTASTKTRAEVKGSSAKPWKQKGTGRARAGRKRSPLWVGGGVIFGPRPRDYSYSIPRKMKRVAIKSILSLKNKQDMLKIIEDFTIESGKTGDLVKILKNIVPSERTVVVLGSDDSMMYRAGKNIPWLKFLAYNRLAAHDLFYGKNVLVLETAATKLNNFFDEHGTGEN